MGIMLAIGDGISPDGFMLLLTETGLWLHTRKNYMKFLIYKKNDWFAYLKELYG